jgi:hypothetical protein
MSQFIILQGLVEGNRFFTDHVKGKDQTKLADGSLAYRVIGYAETVEEAQTKLYGKPFPIRSDGSRYLAGPKVKR